MNMSILERLKKISVNESGSLVTINSVLANDSVNLAARNNPYQSCPCPVFLAIRRMYVRTKAILESWWPYITPLCLFETSQKLQNRFFLDQLPVHLLLGSGWTDNLCKTSLLQQQAACFVQNLIISAAGAHVTMGFCFKKYTRMQIVTWGRSTLRWFLL